jgi:monofunctional biosynthetic peptidoglycan transglycosylase
MIGCSFRLIRRLGCLILLVALGFAAYEWVTWPDVDELETRNPRSTAFMDRYSETRGPAAAIDWRWVPYGQISDQLKAAVLVGEDIDFFSHNGFAIEELKRAVKETVREGEPLRGASTLSQQLVKNLWLSPSRNPWRKVKEALLTVQLERQLTKRRILEIYLNVVEFAPGVYGAEAAALARFRRSAAGLSADQAAALAACLPSPRACGASDPGRAYRDRVERIRRRMDKAEWIKGEL